MPAIGLPSTGSDRDQLDVGLGRRRHRDRQAVVDVVDEACLDAARLGAAKRVADDPRRLGAEVEVVLRRVEGVPGPVEERRHSARDLRRLLPAVRQSADLDALAH